MKRIVLWLLSTVSAVVLLFGYHTSTAGPGGTVSAPSSIVSGSSAGSSGGPGSTTSTPSTAKATTNSRTTTRKATTSAAVTGEVAQTRWGPVQVRLTTSGRKITKVEVLQYPDGNGRDQEINAQALPVLIQETLDQQSAQIDMVSGATVTSGGYQQSLQSALDQVAS